jgi:hypothetical protein
MNSLDEYVNDYVENAMREIIREVNEKKPKDIDYALRHYIQKCKEQLKWFGKYVIFLDKLYHDYLMGHDILEILNKQKVISATNSEGQILLAKFKSLSETEKSKDENEPSEIKRKEPDYKKFAEGFKNIPPFKMPESSDKPETAPKPNKQKKPLGRKEFINMAVGYIAIRELISWLEKNGLVIQEPKTTESLSSTDLETTTIEYCLNNIYKKGKINEENHRKLFDLLYSFFNNNSWNTLDEPILVELRSKKKIAAALGQIYKKLRAEPISYDYLMLGKKNIALFSEEVISQESFQKSNLYKYYTSNSERI